MRSPRLHLCVSPVLMAAIALPAAAKEPFTPRWCASPRPRTAWKDGLAGWQARSCTS